MSTSAFGKESSSVREQRAKILAAAAKLQLEPCRATLLALLRIADPEISSDQLDDKHCRNSALSALKVIIEEGSSESDKAVASRRLGHRFWQHPEEYFEKACQTPTLQTTASSPSSEQEPQQKKARTSSTVSPESSRPKKSFPKNYHVQEQWPYLFTVNQPEAPPGTQLDHASVSKAIGFKCINEYGAIAHEKDIEIWYDIEHVMESGHEGICSASELLDSFGGHAKVDGIDEIKEHLMTKGPVISMSFRLTQEFYDHCKHSSCFEESLIGSKHPVLVVGWKSKPYGELLLIRSIRGDSDIPLVGSQFSVEDEVVVPRSDFSNHTWQNDSTVYKCDFGSDDDRSWLHDPVFTKVFPASGSSKSDILPMLLDILDCTLLEALSSRKPFVLMDFEKHAWSRTVFLKDVAWNKHGHHWEVTFAQVREEAEENEHNEENDADAMLATSSSSQNASMSPRDSLLNDSSTDEEEDASATPKTMTVPRRSDYRTNRSFYEESDEEEDDATEKLMEEETGDLLGEDSEEEDDVSDTFFLEVTEGWRQNMPSSILPDAQVRADRNAVILGFKKPSDLYKGRNRFVKFLQEESLCTPDEVPILQYYNDIETSKQEEFARIILKSAIVDKGLVFYIRVGKALPCQWRPATCDELLQKGAPAIKALAKKFYYRQS